MSEHATLQPQNSQDNSLSRDFKGIWIPREIWLMPNLSMQAKALWAEIHSLDCGDGCYASDEYLANFLGLSRSRSCEVLKELRDRGLVITLRNDGRHRYLRAMIPEVTGYQMSGKPDTTHPENRTLDKSIDIATKNNSLKVQPPNPVAAKSAKASDVDFSSQVLDTTNSLIASLKQTKPDYVPPKNLVPIYTHVDLMLRVDKFTPERVLNVFRWALADDFWQAHMFAKNPASYLRSKFHQLEMKMNAKPGKKRSHLHSEGCGDDYKRMVDEGGF